MALRSAAPYRIAIVATSTAFTLLACSSTEGHADADVAPSVVENSSATQPPNATTSMQGAASTPTNTSSTSASNTGSVSQHTASTATPSSDTPADSTNADSTPAESADPSTTTVASSSSDPQETSSGDITLPPEPPVDAFAMAVEMGVGTNIGNTLENTTEWEVGWGQPLISREFIDGIASNGIKTVRVPVAWDTYATNGELDPSKLSRVKDVVGWINEAGLFAVVNIHWDGGWIFNEHLDTEFQLTDDVRTKFVSYWTQIATGFADVGHKLVFEGMNEEGRFFVGGDSTGTPDYAPLNELNQLFVTTVRAQGGYNESRALLVAGFQTDITLTCVDAFEIPDDPAGPDKLFLSLHYYTPYTFCGLDTVETWGSPATTWGTDAERSELDGLFDILGSFSQARNIPIILGEFGATPGESYPREPASRTAWMGAVTEACLTRGMVPLLWDTGSEIDRTDGTFSDEWAAVMNSL